MIWPPSILRIRIQSGRRGFRIWLPLCLFWPPAAVVMALLAPLVIVLAALVWPFGWGRPVLLTGPLLFKLFCSLRGLEMAVESAPQQVLISFR